MSKVTEVIITSEEGDTRNVIKLSGDVANVWATSLEALARLADENDWAYPDVKWEREIWKRHELWEKENGPV
jgi:hypothetical protein